MLACVKATSLKHVIVALAFIGASITSTGMNKDDGLHGAWTCISATVDGKALSKDTAAALRLTITQDRYKTEKPGEVLFDSTYRVDASRSPRQINMVGTEGDLKGKEAQGIYSIEKDILRICYTMPGDGRPERFESLPGSKAYLVVWKRERK